MMPTKRPKRPRDVNQLAKHVVDIATGEATDAEPEPTGRAVGGHARSANMTPEERSEMAKMGAAARWGHQTTGQ